VSDVRSMHRSTRRAVAARGTVVACVLALVGCSDSGGDAPELPASFQVREIAVAVPVDEYVAMVEADCPGEPLPAEQAGWLCSADESVAYLMLPAALTGAEVASTDTSESGGSWQVNVDLTDSGERVLIELTASAASRDPKGAIALVIDGRVQSAPVVWEAITGGPVALVGDWTEGEATSLAARVVG
jgi:preprotein translocase subunit SecD